MQVMALLPDVGLKISLRPFTNAAVDYAGPFIMIKGRSIEEQNDMCAYSPN